ncbi:MAG: 50S ribosomal protein L32 [Candidatus Komeilibacteria bacterium]|nr:50S ribosomal protein L32 [Candidatus Komeilibacteria bacterium]
MGLPSQKRTKSSKKRRASHFALRLTGVNHCPKCQAPILSHHVCKNCGFYKGREVIKIKSKVAKKKK